MSLSDWFKRNSEKERSQGVPIDSSNPSGTLEFYEDTHDSSGRYVGMPQQDQPNGIPTKVSINDAVSSGNGILLYNPRTPEDVQEVIIHIRSGSPAIVNLEDIEPEVAQRILDFISGAAYAICGTVKCVSGNIFVVSPNGMEITMSYEQK